MHFEDFTISVTFVHVKANSKEFHLAFWNTAESAILFKLKKMTPLDNEWLPQFFMDSNSPYHDLPFSHGRKPGRITVIIN